MAAEVAKRQAKAAALLAESGSLITNGDFQTKDDKAEWPKHWDVQKQAVGSRKRPIDFCDSLQMSLVNWSPFIARFDIPANAKAIELTWQQRVTGLKKGELPWHDARIMLDFLDASGKKLSQPSPLINRKILMAGPT